MKEPPTTEEFSVTDGSWLTGSWLYGREATWTECVEVQEVREDEMDAKWLREPFDLKKVNEVCERCKW